MYLRVIYELGEEGIEPRQIRIAERAGTSAPTVNETTARMERDGLLSTTSDRPLALTPVGQARAIAVMRKHRVSECFLHHTVHLDWEDLHVEASRWQHVLSDVAERAILQVLGFPTVSPFGNPIPGIDALMGRADSGIRPWPDTARHGTRLHEFARRGGGRATVVLLPEGLQSDPTGLAELRTSGIRPGRTITVLPAPSDDSAVTVAGAPAHAAIAPAVARAIVVLAG
ncbi:metal-dependent transcriptional regulator [Pseudonocardia sp. GCM10023141]|uniref:metal-dependent transcriptional regulator n=1 Tax=Pseudonocardia sp. GCM10023141 TaxID=3252653 RepID=UPI003623619C